MVVHRQPRSLLVCRTLISLITRGWLVSLAVCGKLVIWCVCRLIVRLIWADNRRELVWDWGCSRCMVDGRWVGCGIMICEWCVGRQCVSGPRLNRGGW